MTKPSTRLFRILIGVVLAGLVSGCNYFSPQAPRLPHCVSAEIPASETIDQALVGRWRQPTIGDATSAAMFQMVGQNQGDAQWEFRPDHTGDMWWWDPGGASYGPSAAGTESFTWRVEEDLLYVNNLPPASMLVVGGRLADGSRGDAGILVTVPGEPDDTGILLIRCELFEE